MTAVVHAARGIVGATRKELLIMRRYLSNTIVTVAWGLTIPLAYVAQAQGFAGTDGQAVDAFAARAGTNQVIAYLYLGWAVFLWVSMMLWGPGMSLRSEQVRGSLEAIFMTPVSRFTMLFGAAPAHMIVATVVFAVVGIMLRFVFGVPIGLSQFLGGIAVIVASVPVLFALGGLFAVLVLRFRDAEGLGAALRGLVAVACGVTYPIAILPGWMQPVSQALPPTQILDVLRASMLLPDGLSNELGRLVSLVVVGIVLGFVAVALFARTIRVSTRSGRLGQF